MLQPIKQSTTSLGKAFEKHCQLLLSRQLCMDLTHVGGKGDRGIDLRGWWRLPDARRKDGTDGRRRIRVLVQCKAERLKAGPRLIRELEGTWRQAVSERAAFNLSLGKDDNPSHSHTNGGTIEAVAIACTASGFSTAAAKDLARSNIPMLLLHVPLSSMTTDILDTDTPSELEADDSTSPHVDHEDPSDLGPDPSDVFANRIPIRGALWNQALSSPSGLLAGIEIRRIFPFTNTASRENQIGTIKPGNDGARDELDFGLGLFLDGKEIGRTG